MLLLKNIMTLSAFLLTTSCLWGTGSSNSDKFEVLKKTTYFPLYESFLKKTKQKSPPKWTIEEIPSNDFVPEASGPLEPFENAFIIWVNKDTERQIGFRPLEVTTGCKSGCTPVSFHLVFDKKGDCLDILIDPSKPLRKVGHVPFSESDMKKLLNITKNLPKSLELIEHPLELTNSSVFPPQTWTSFTNDLIPTGAYTAYMVYKIALETKRLLNLNSSEEKKLRLEENMVLALFQTTLESDADFSGLFEKITAIADKSLHPKNARRLYQHSLSLISFFITKKDESKTPLTKDQISTLVKLLNKYSVVYTTSLENLFFDFLWNLNISKQGAFFLITLTKEFKEWSKVPEDLKLYLPFLANCELDDSSKIAEGLKTISLEKLLAFLSQKNNLLQLLANRLETKEHKAKALEVYAYFKARFPKAPMNFKEKLTKDEEQKLDQLSKIQVAIYQAEFLREISQDQIKLPKGLATNFFEKEKPFRVSIPKQDKQIYIFFAPWCGHCFQLLGFLTEHLSKDMWKKIQLVAVFLKDDSKKQIDEFLTQSQLKSRLPEVYKETLGLIEGEDTKKFYEEISLLAVPKIVLTKKSGEILHYNFELAMDPLKDLERDLRFILN